MSITPICKACGLEMRFMVHPPHDWWDCECGQAYDREHDLWVF